MASGIEMMMTAAIKALGIDPKIILGQAEELKKNVEGGIDRLDARLAEIERVQNEILDRFIKLLENEHE